MVSVQGEQATYYRVPRPPHTLTIDTMVFSVDVEDRDAEGRDEKTNVDWRWLEGGRGVVGDDNLGILSAQWIRCGFVTIPVASFTEYQRRAGRRIMIRYQHAWSWHITFVGWGAFRKDFIHTLTMFTVASILWFGVVYLIILSSDNKSVLEVSLLQVLPHVDTDSRSFSLQGSMKHYLESNDHEWVIAW